MTKQRTRHGGMSTASRRSRSMIVARAILFSTVIGVASVLTFGCASIASASDPTLLLEERFEEEHVLVGKPERWHWVPHAADIWVNEADDVPQGYGPYVLTIGRGSSSTAHIALRSQLLEDATDYEVTVLWVDRTVVGELNDSDFHIGVRAQATDEMDMQAPDHCYEVEIDGDKADATNLMPEDGPTHFHLFVRGDVQRPLDHASAELFQQPVRNTWYWTTVRVVGSSIWAKTWPHGTVEPDWMLSATDEQTQYPTGTVRLGVWSGKAEVAYVAVRRAEQPLVSREVPEEEDDGPTTDEPWQSALLSVDPNGSVSYAPDESGHVLPDFSYVGYRRGEEQLPNVSTVITVSPPNTDATAAIQAAIDAVAARPIGEDGYRGAVELTSGVYRVSGTIRLNADGVVLRGAGSGPQDGSIIQAVGSSPAGRDAVVLGSGMKTNWETEVAGTRCEIISPVVPLGSTSFTVSDGALLAPGDNIIITQPGTQAWMATIDNGGTGNDRGWRAGEVPLVFNRYVERVDGNQITIDAPLYMSLDREPAPSYVYVHSRTGIVTNVGIEDLRVEIVPERSGAHAANGIAFTGVEDAWAREVAVTGFQLSGVIIQTGSRITVDGVSAIDPAHKVETGYLYNFNAAKAAQQVLFTNCHASDGRHHFISNGMSWNSGLVFHRTTSSGAWATSEGHRRWTMGMLFDVHTELDGPRAGGTPILLGLYNRGDYGTGHGWAAVNSVAWNSDVAEGYAVIQRPPLGQNFGIGVRGSRVTGRGPFDQPGGYIEGVNRSGLQPESLYEAQLQARVQTVSR